MRRLAQVLELAVNCAMLVFLMLLVGLMLWPRAAHAQSAPAPLMLDTMLVGPNSAAVTFCHVEHGQIYARTFVDARALGSPALTEILVHERVHRDDMASDSTYCAGRPRDVLKTEVHAYCVSGQFAVTLGAAPLGVYLATLNTLVHQFADTDVPYNDVVSAWFTECAAPLHFPSVPAAVRDSTRQQR